MSRLPAADAGGSELQSSFYADSQLASQTQAGQTVGYNLDPTGRPREIVSTGKILASEAQHYAGPSSTPAWTSEISGNWTRNITSLGGLVAIQHNGEAPVLQLTNLHGDIVATALDTEMATALSSKIGESSEYGVPATEAPPKYSWLGAHQLPTELPSGVIQMGARSYIPQLGRYLQTDPQPGGSANAYAYVFGDPINTTDLTGENASGPSAWAISLAAELTSGEAAAYETAVREEAQRKAAEAAAQAGNTITPGSPESGSAEEEWTEEEGEESGEEYAAFGPSPKTSAPHMTEEEAAGIYVQPLKEGQEPSGSVQKPLPLCGRAHEDHPCGREVCVFDRGLGAPVFLRGSYTYVEICGRRGRHAGKRIGYLRVYTPTYNRSGRSLAGRVVEGTVGATVLITGVGAAMLCAIGSEGLDAAECARAASGPVLAGALAVWNSLT
jgi:RHS repeat-associated protein